MCEPIMPIDTLKNLRFSIAVLPNLHEPGSYRKELAELACAGIRSRLDWVIANLEHAKEGQKNFGLSAYPGLTKGDDDEPL